MNRRRFLLGTSALVAIAAVPKAITNALGFTAADVKAVDRMMAAADLNQESYVCFVSPLAEMQAMVNDLRNRWLEALLEGRPILCEEGELGTHPEFVKVIEHVEVDESGMMVWPMEEKQLHRAPDFSPYEWVLR